MGKEAALHYVGYSLDYAIDKISILKQLLVLLAFTNPAFSQIVIFFALFCITAADDTSLFIAQEKAKI